MRKRGTSAGDKVNHTDMAGRRGRPRGRYKSSRGRLVRLKQSKATTYRSYMRSAAWRELRAAWWATYDKRNRVRRCYVCDITQAEYGRMSFDLHHMTYERLGREAYTDLVPLCGGPGRCHDIVTRRWRARHKTGLTLTLRQLTDQVRAEVRAQQRAERRRAVA